MLTISSAEDKIILTDAPEWARGMFNSVPGASFRRNATWWYPRSPFVIGRLEHKLNESNMDRVFDGTTDALFDQMSNMLHSAKMKYDQSGLRPYLTATKPWHHQSLASKWLSDKPYGYLAMEMGTGKTLVSLNEILVREPRRTLIMCPKTVIDVWVDEFATHAPGCDHFIIPLVKGTSKFKAELAESRYRDALITRRPFVLIVNYETAWREPVAKFILSQQWEMVIADEGHKLKAPGSRISRFAAKIQKRSDFRLCLSGTPLPNNQLDAYGQYRYLDVGVFGSNFARFRARYADVQTFKGFPEIIGWRNQDQFNRILDLTMFRVDKDVLDLPPITHVRRMVQIPAKSQKIYDQLMKTFVADVDSGEVTASNALVRLLKFQQITSGFITDDEGGITDLHSEKRGALEDIIDGVSGEPVVVFCRFRRDLQSVREVAEKHGRLYGEVSGSGNVLEGGKIPSGYDVLGVQIQAGGVGVNLNASRLCVFFSLGFSLAEYEQAVARLHRGGQKSAVTVYHLIARDTVDEHVDEAIALKKKAVDAIMSYVKGER